MPKQQPTVKNKKNYRLPIIVFCLVIAGLLLGALAVWANQEYRYSRIAGVRDLERLDFDCSGEFAEAVFYQAECSVDYNYSLTNYDNDNEDSSIYGKPDYGDDQWKILFEDYPWIWEDLGVADNQHLLHGGTRHIIYDESDSYSGEEQEDIISSDGDSPDEDSGEYEYPQYGAGGGPGGSSYWSLQFATGPLEVIAEGDDWDYPYYNSPEEEGQGYNSSWRYAGPFTSNVVCEDVVDYLPTRAVYNVSSSDEQTSGRDSRAVIEVDYAFYEDAYPIYCFQVHYTLDGDEQTGWVKAVVPLEELWRQVEERIEEIYSGEIDTDISDAEANDLSNLAQGLGDEENEEDVPTTTPNPDDDTPPSPEEAPYDPASGIDEEGFDTILSVKTFKDQAAKAAYFVANIDSHPCSATPLLPVLDGDLSVIYQTADQAAIETRGADWTEAVLSLVLENLPSDDSSFQTYELKLCADIITALEQQALGCQTDGQTIGICSGGIDTEMLETIEAVAADCQRMYDIVNADTSPLPSALADCLQLSGQTHQDFIDVIRIVRSSEIEDLEFGSHLGAHNPGLYILEEGVAREGVPYVFWDDQTEDTLDGSRFQFELVALHEYMHKYYFQNLSLKDRMRFNREVLALSENYDERFFDYLGYSDLSDETQHRIYRHGSAALGLKALVEDELSSINEVAPQLIDALPAGVKTEYAEFLNDRHGVVAFVYALAETQAYMLFGEASGFESDQVLSGVEDFIKQGEFEQITMEYSASIASDYESEGSAARRALYQLMARMPSSIVQDGSIYDINFGLSETDRLKRVQDLREEITALREEIQELVDQFLDDFRDQLEAELTREYGNAYEKFFSLLVDEVVNELEYLVFDNPDLAEDEDNAIDEIVGFIMNELDEVSTQELTAWEQQVTGGPEEDSIDRADSDTDSDTDSDIGYFAFAIERITSKMFERYDGKDTVLLGAYLRFSGFFVESYPILGLEMPAGSSDWLEEHYNQYINRSALSKYFKYHPPLELNYSPDLGR